MYTEKKVLIKTENLSRSFSSGGTMQHVLRNIDLELYQGDFTIIMGASGAGKSTLLYSLSGMDRPSLGRIYFGDTVISDLNTDSLAVFRRKHCGFVFQQIHLIDSMSVMDNVLAAGLLADRNKKAVTARAAQLFGSVGIDEFTQKKFPPQLSGGEAQRVGIVRALVNNPEILFADEPTGALNSQTGKDVLDTMTRFHEQGQSVVMVTHDMRSARRGNRILYLKDGIILGELRPGRYVSGDKKRHEQIAGFLQEMGW